MKRLVCHETSHRPQGLLEQLTGHNKHNRAESAGPWGMFHTDSPARPGTCLFTGKSRKQQKREEFILANS